MPNTPYLGITEVSASQNQKEVTINDAIIALEAATNAVLTTDYTGITTYTLTGTQATRNMIFKGITAAADCDIKFPISVGGNTFIRVFVVRNDTGHNLTVKYASGAGTTVVVPNGHSRLIAALDGVNMIVAAEPATAVHFVDLLDVPGSYTGGSGKAVAVKTDESGLEFITVSNFPSFTSKAHKVLAVNTGETGVEWVSVVTNFTALTDAPASYTSKANKLVSVKADESGLEFIDPPPSTAVEYPTSDQWRIRVVTGGGATQAGFGEIQMLDVDGINRATGGTPTSSSYDTGHEPTYAFDTITTTGNGWLSAVSDVVGAWIKYTFAAPLSIRSIKIWGVNGFETYTPDEFIIERWNGTAWVNLGDRIPATWVDGASQTFLVNGEPLSSVADVTSDGVYYTRRNAVWASFSAALDSYTSTRGSILFRGATDWSPRSPSTDGKILRDKGVGADPIWDTVSNVLDVLGSTQGDILYRNATGWVVLAPGTAGQSLLSGGSSANPVWSSSTLGSLTADTDGTLAANSDSNVATQKATKTYVDNKVNGLSWKQEVRAASTTNTALSTGFANGSVIDGVTLVTGDRILIKNQATTSDNGIYTVNVSGAPTRALDANTGANLVNATCYVSEGTVNADTQWTCTTNAVITLGSTALAFAQLGSTSGALLVSNNLSDLGSTSTARSNLGLGTVAVLASDTDVTLAANSDSNVATQKAIKTYVDNKTNGLFNYVSATDCSGNPNYPAASKGAAYRVSVAGKIGGASGVSVDIGDIYFAIADNAGGTQAGVGTSWTVLEHNLVGALLSANNLADVGSVPTTRTNLAIDRRVASFQIIGAAPTASEPLFAWTPASGETVTIAGNFVGATYRKTTAGLNPGSAYTMNVLKNGSVVGTIAISTSGLVTYATTSGASITLIGGTDCLEVIGSSSTDANAVGYTFTLLASATW